MDSEFLMEILSAFTGTTVKHHTAPRTKNSTELTVHNFLSPALLNTLRSSQSKVLTGLTLHLTSTDEIDCAGGGPEMFLKLEDFHDKKYDCDFRNLSSSETKCMRGEEVYTRPQGYYRFAVKVLKKYPGGDVWLGPDGWRKQSVPGEWPVSFHGTSLTGAEGVIQDHFKPGRRDTYGRGIYSTPKLSEAEKYSTPVMLKNGKTYKIILQNRINPAYRTICENKDYWLIPISKGTSPQDEERIVNNAIRPYGILVKEEV